jgi:hypothetical protein
LTARTDAAAEAAEVAAVEAATRHRWGRRESCRCAWRASGLGARAALASVLPKEPGGGAGGMAEDAEEIPGRP